MWLVCPYSCVPIAALVAFLQNENRTWAKRSGSEEVEGRCKGCAPVPLRVSSSPCRKETAARGSAASIECVCRGRM